MAEFVTVINANGGKQRIPAHWLKHPVLGKGFRLPPSARESNQRSAATPAPAETPPAGDDNTTEE